MRFACTLSARACATRHAARWLSGGRRGTKKIKPCDQCELGARVLGELEAAGWQRPPDQDAPEVMPEPQRRARAKWLCSHLIEPGGGEPDPLREVAELVPEDGGHEPGLPDL